MQPKKKYRFTKLFIWITLIILINITAFLVLVNIPAVQTELAQYLSRKLSQKTGFAITINEVNIAWFDRFSLQGLTVTDDRQQELLTLDKLQINYKLVSVLRGEVNLDKVTAANLNLYLHKEPRDTLNISRLINRLNRIFRTKKKREGRSSFGIDEIYLTGSNFYYVNGHRSLAGSHFNPYNFSVLDIEGQFRALMVVKDSFMVDVISLQARESTTGLAVQDMQTSYLISPRQMRFEFLNLEIGRSVLNKNLVLTYNGYDDLSTFIDSVYIEAEFDQARVSSKDLARFNTYFNNITDDYRLSGLFTGEIADFRVKDMVLKLGTGSTLAGTVYFSGLPNIDDTFINIRLENSTINEKDIEQYVPSEKFKAYNRFRHVHLNGSFTGYPTDFVAYGRFDTNLGRIITDINLKIAPNPEYTAYSGKLQLHNFDVGQYLENNLVGKTTVHGRIKGRGIKMANANFTFDGTIDSLWLHDYNYTNITTNGTFEHEFFSGLLAVDDPNLKLHTINEIDLRHSRNKVMIKGELALANLRQLNLTQEAASIKTKIEADFRGFAIDSIIGHVFLEDLFATHQENKLLIKTLTLSSLKRGRQREVELFTDRANVKMWGAFNFTSAYKDFRYMVKEYQLSLQNNKDSIARFYQEYPHPDNSQPYAINARARFKDIHQFISLFEPALNLHQTTALDLQFRHGKASSFALQLTNDSLTYAGTLLTGNTISINATKIVGQPAILAAMDVQSARQKLANGAELDNLIVSAVWDNNVIDFNWYHTQPNINNVNDIYGEVRFYPDSTQVHFNQSNLSLLGETWQIQDNNTITLNHRQIRVSNLNIFSREQMISANGVISPNPEKSLDIKASNLNLNLVNPLINKEISGRLSGEFSLAGLYQTPTMVSNIYINQLAINQFEIGDIYSSNDWDQDSKLFEIQFIVSRNDQPTILVNGVFNPLDRQNALNLNAAFMNARLNMLEPFIETIFSNLQGNITGNIHLTGPVRSPVVTGQGAFNQAGLRVNYLNTFYTVEGTWAFDSSNIYLQQLALTDDAGHHASLNGKFTHRHFKNFRLDLRGEMTDFKVLNTTASDNSLYYGTGIGTGTVTFTGPVEDITIRAKAITNKGTKFFLPMGDSQTSKFEDFISFVDFSDSLNSLDFEAKEDVKITGINMEFDLEITEDAYGEIIFDINSGDIIRGRGKGHLSMNINTQGEFTMLGTYEIVDGRYNFTMYNIVNKEFTIQPKSKITWSGDPYNGIMDIDATYKVATSLAPLVDTAYQDMPDVKRIYPTEVLLGINGPLLSPDIAFAILIDDYPKSNVDLDTQVKAFLNTIATDQQELNRQVFSLLILRKFSPPNSFSSSGTIGSSVSEFVSNQLSYWISQVDENLTIDMDLGQLDENALNTFQLRVSYAFMEGKLIVTRDGGFTNPNNEATVGSIAGDWTLEYLLSDDGKLRIKLFNKTNYNQLNSSTGSASQALITGGFSLIYTTSFDSLGDLFRNTRKKKEQKPNIEPSTSALKPEEIQYKVPH